MRLTRHTDYALRTLQYLALHEGEASRIDDIARRMGMPADHVAKVVARLAALGYVATSRGRVGGVRLAREAGAIGIGDVVRATEDNLELVECFDPVRNNCPIAPACSLAPALGAALDAFFDVLDGVTLADLVRRRRAIADLMLA